VRVDNDPDDADIPYPGDVVIQKSKSDLFKGGVADEDWENANDFFDIF